MMSKIISLPFVLAILLASSVAPSRAVAATVFFEGIIYTVYDPDDGLDGSVVEGGTISGSYTFDPSIPPSSSGSTYATYDYVANGEMVSACLPAMRPCTPLCPSSSKVQLGAAHRQGTAALHTNMHSQVQTFPLVVHHA